MSAATQENRAKPMRDARRKLGTAGEEMAARHLMQSGFTVIARNWRATDGGFGRELAGEIDLIAEEIAPNLVSGAQETWRVLVEDRTRRGDAYGSALQSITPTKAKRMRALASAYIQASQWTGPWRIDVVAIQMDSRGVVQSVAHVRGAVQDA